MSISYVIIQGEQNKQTNTKISPATCICEYVHFFRLIEINHQSIYDREEKSSTKNNEEKKPMQTI